MVTDKKIGDKTVFLCDICVLGYAEESQLKNAKIIDEPTKARAVPK